MSTAEKAESRPSSPAPSDRQKESRDVIFASHGGKTYEIPLSGAQQYESQDTHDQSGGDDEVGGRHKANLQSGMFGYHSDWLHGPYVWITDGRTYNGYHWHPNVYSPIGCDMDNYY
jgi:hypothetical protein